MDGFLPLRCAYIRIYVQFILFIYLFCLPPRALGNSDKHKELIYEALYSKREQDTEGDADIE